MLRRACGRGHLSPFKPAGGKGVKSIQVHQKHVLLNIGIVNVISMDMFNSTVGLAVLGVVGTWEHPPQKMWCQRKLGFRV